MKVCSICGKPDEDELWDHEGETYCERCLENKLNVETVHYYEYPDSTYAFDSIQKLFEDAGATRASGRRVTVSMVKKILGESDYALVLTLSKEFYNTYNCEKEESVFNNVWALITSIADRHHMNFSFDDNYPDKLTFHVKGEDKILFRIDAFCGKVIEEEL